MKLSLCISTLLCLLFREGDCLSQESSLNPVLTRDKNYGSVSFWGTVTDIKQDPWGYIWFSTAFKGLQRYDGVNLLTYQHQEQDLNSLSNNRVPNFIIDSSGIIWAATYGGGLDQFDPVQNRFIHFRHDVGDPGSLSNDTVFCVLRDHTGNLWAGTYGGLDMLNEKTGKFKHFKNIPGDPSSISFNRIWYLYEDRQGTLWVGCGSPFLTFGEKPEEGGLNRFDRTSGKFIRYLHNTNDSTSIANNKVRAIYEDSKNNFWIGGAENTLQKMDRKTGKFTRYNYDPKHSEQLSGPAVKFHEALAITHITFINEDSKGVLWIGSAVNGTNRYDPTTKKITHIRPNLFRSFNSANGQTWFSSSEGDVYNIDPSKAMIPYHRLSRLVNSLYYDEDKHVLWIGGKGLVYKEIISQSDTGLSKQPNKSFIADTINGMEGDGNGNLWIASSGGLLKFDLKKRTFSAYKHLDTDSTSISGDHVASLFIDHNKNIWCSSGNWVIDKLNPSSGVFTHYSYNTDPNNLINDYASCFSQDHTGDIWFGARGLFRMHQTSGKLSKYLESSIISGICADANGNVWSGSNDGLFLYDSARDRFRPFNHPFTGSAIKGIKNILEDNNRNLWVSTTTSIIKINDKRNEIKIYGEHYGVHENTLLHANNFKSENGELYLLDQNGYYFLDPSSIKPNEEGPALYFTGFEIGNRKDLAETTVPSIQPMRESETISLDYDQNTFSIDFFAVDYKHPGPLEYVFMLENYDDSWRYNGKRTSVNLIKIPPGQYRFKVKAVNQEGIWSEKAISVFISPPWWRTWWAYTTFAVLFAAAVWAFIYYRSLRLRRENRILEEKVSTRTLQLQQEKQNVEIALSELKSTQAQLIQSEKMASLGELTAGIAHEIQNPLNFVNNFSEVNKELIEEVKSEKLKDKSDRDEELENQLLNDIEQNLEKINYHGKRADAIVKGMLQHSQKSSGQKEPTDINALCDEYLRLAYHGLRAKDRSFNAVPIAIGIKTDFDNTIGKINVVPQDISRVVLNLINNAFYAVNERAKQEVSGYEPTVIVGTRGLQDRIEIRVKDNGNGIPDSIKDKIFQPFFTTKPTGQGTGLGLSLAYDIVKAHGGEIKVKTIEGEGAEFIIELTNA